MAKKPKTITKLKKELWKILAAYIKKRDNYTCWLCDTRVIGSSLHCSHILPKGSTQYPRYEFEEWNLKSLCLGCHMNYWHKNPIEAAEQFKRMYPNKYSEVLKRASEYKSAQPYSREVILTKIAHYKGTITW